MAAHLVAPAPERHGLVLIGQVLEVFRRVQLLLVEILSRGDGDKVQAKRLRGRMGWRAKREVAGTHIRAMAGGRVFPEHTCNKKNAKRMHNLNKSQKSGGTIKMKMQHMLTKRREHIRQQRTRLYIKHSNTNSSNQNNIIKVS